MNYFLGDQERDLIKVCVLLHIKGEVSRFSGMLINQNAFFNAGTDCIVHASDMIMSVLSKNQSAHSSSDLAVTWSTYVQIAVSSSTIE